MWTTFFDHSFDFPKGYNKFKRALSIIVMILLVFSYIHSFEIHVLMYDKLLKVLTLSEWTDFILNDSSN